MGVGTGVGVGVGVADAVGSGVDEGIGVGIGATGDGGGSAVEATISGVGVTVGASVAQATVKRMIAAIRALTILLISNSLFPSLFPPRAPASGSAASVAVCSAQAPKEVVWVDTRLGDDLTHCSGVDVGSVMPWDGYALTGVVYQVGVTAGLVAETPAETQQQSVSLGKPDAGDAWRHQTATVTDATSIRQPSSVYSAISRSFAPSGAAGRGENIRNPSMASTIMAKASSRSLPCDMQPGRDGQNTAYPGSKSSDTSRTSNSSLADAAAFCGVVDGLVIALPPSVAR